MSGGLHYPQISTPHGNIALPRDYKRHLHTLLRQTLGAPPNVPGKVVEIPQRPQARRSRQDRYRPVLGPRIPPPNHHLWNNHGVWFLVYTVYPTPLTKERVRRSLQTRDVAVARERRDAILLSLASRQMLASYRFPGSRAGQPSTDSGAA